MTVGANERKHTVYGYYLYGKMIAVINENKEAV